MNIIVISTSMRANSQSLRVSEYLVRRLQALEQNAWLLDLFTFRLPMYDDVSEPQERAELRKQLASADGFVFVSPEWDGMMSFGLINMLLHTEQELAHKPVMLTGVSSGRGGAYPISQMRQIGPKNKHYVITPENLRLQEVKTLFLNDSFDPNEPDVSVKQRVEYTLKVLIAYTEALKPVRNSNIVDMTLFPSGV